MEASGKRRFKDSKAWWDGESEVRDGVGRNETGGGGLIKRVARRFAGICIVRRDIVNPRIPNQAGLAGRETRSTSVTPSPPV